MNATTAPAIPTRQLLAEARQCSPSERRRLEDRAVRLNMPLARSLASRYAGRGLALDDLRQVAYLGLVKAVRGYDPERGGEFLSYAVPTIRGELRRHFRDAGWMVRPPRRLQELQARVWAAEVALTQKLNRSPTASEIADALDVELDEVLESLATDGCFAPSSLDAPQSQEDSGSLGERIGGPDIEYERTDARLMITDAVRRLPPRDRRIIELRFYRGWTQQQIGDDVGVSQMQVSRVLARIYSQLRAVITGSAASRPGLPPAPAPAPPSRGRRSA